MYVVKRAARLIETWEYSGALKVHICIKNAKIREINYLSDNNVQILQSGISAAKPDPFSGFNPILDPIFF